MGNVASTTKDETVPVELIISNYSDHEIDEITISDSDLQYLFVESCIHSQERVKFSKNIKTDELLTDDCPLTLCLHFKNRTVDIISFHGEQNYNTDFFEHVSRSHKIDYEGDNFVYEIIINNTAYHFQNKHFEELREEAASAMQKQHYEVALEKFDKALHLTNDEKIGDCIKTEQANAYYRLGKVLLKKGWDLEQNQESYKSEEVFNEVKSMFMKAENCSSEWERQRNLKIIALKIEGNRLLDEGKDLEKSAEELYSANIYKEAKKKYIEALIKFKAAQDNFDQGLKMTKEFKSSSLESDKCVANVLKIVNDIDTKHTK